MRDELAGALAAPVALALAFGLLLLPAGPAWSADEGESPSQPGETEGAAPGTEEQAASEAEEAADAPELAAWQWMERAWQLKEEGDHPAAVLAVEAARAAGADPQLVSLELGSCSSDPAGMAWHGMHDGAAV